MKRSTYREQDYAFGQIMLTLRTAMGLTQSGLADVLGVSRRSVADWEAGGKYPSVDHLKHFITFAVHRQAFPTGRAQDDIRALWKAARQKVLLDEVWLTNLLSDIVVPRMPTPVETVAVASRVTAPLARGKRVDWGDALAISTIYGRAWELTLLQEWIVKERCRVVSILGLGGIGKSALSVRLMHLVADQFEVVIWRSLRDAPTCEVLLGECLQVIAPQAADPLPADVKQRLNLLLDHLRGQRVLLVLDNLETLLEQGAESGHMRAGYEDYERLLRRVGEADHQSCVLLTSREKPIDLVALEGNQSPVRVLRLSRLEAEPCDQLLAERGLIGNVADRARLIDAYAGNPLALKIVSQTIVDLFDGEIAPFVEQGEIIFGGIRDLLAEHFKRLSNVEQSVLLWLAIMREPSTLDELQTFLVTPAPRARLMEAIEALHRRSLIERGQKRGSFTLQSVVLEYVTARLITEVSDEIQAGTLLRLIEHSIEFAQAHEYIRQTHARLLVAPILANLRSDYLHHDGVEGHLLTLLSQFKTLAGYAQGYGPANLLALLRVQRGNLRGLDLSHLTLRGAYLQGVEMQDATLSGATMQASIFTETFDAILAVAISNTGEYWAASSRRGEVRLWTATGPTLRRTWQAHVDMIWALAFSPDGITLASGSWDGAVKLWDVASGALMWSGRHASYINRMVFTPDGRLLASSGNDAIVRLWDVRTGAQLQTLAHPDPVVAITWHPDGQLLVSGDVEGSIRVWQLQAAEPAVCVQILPAHTTWVNGLAFAPDGTTLASGSWDTTVKLWDVATGDLRETLTGHTDRVSSLAWSPDGYTLASGSRDESVWLWDVEQRSYRVALHGHSAGVDGISFTPDSHSLLSGSQDGTLRLWDVASGRCVRVMEGYAPFIYVLDWSPDGTQMVSGGTDSIVTIWDAQHGTPPKTLQGHNGVVCGVGWSPDGRRVASSEWANAICLWEPVAGVCLQVLRHPDDSGNCFYNLAWSPDGQRLASGTNRHGVQVFDMKADTHHWDGQQFPTIIRHVAWSPAGSLLAGGGDDGTVYVWNPLEQEAILRLSGHQGTVKSLAWSPDGTRLASSSSGSAGGELFVWDIAHGERVASFTEPSGLVSAVVWGMSETLLVSGGGDGTLRWWDVRRGENLLARSAHQGTVQSLRRTPDGSTLASCGVDGTIMLWDMSTGDPIQTLRRDRPYERLNITGIKGLTEAQKQTLHALGAIEDNPV